MVSKITFPCFTTSVESSDTSTTTVIPAEYSEFSEVFSKAKATQLPLHHPWYCAIDIFFLNTTPPKSKDYPLSRPETQAMEKLQCLNIRFYLSLYLSSSGSIFLCGEKRMLTKTMHWLSRSQCNHTHTQKTYPFLLSFQYLNNSGRHVSSPDKIFKVPTTLFEPERGVNGRLPSIPLGGTLNTICHMVRSMRPLSSSFSSMKSSETF